MQTLIATFIYAEGRIWCYKAFLLSFGKIILTIHFLLKKIIVIFVHGLKGMFFLTNRRREKKKNINHNFLI